MTTLGKLAEQKVKDVDVKEFAAAMIKDHTMAAEELNRAAKLDDAPAKLSSKHAAMLELLKGASDKDFKPLYIEMQTVGAYGGSFAVCHLCQGRRRRGGQGLCSQDTAQIGNAQDACDAPSGSSLIRSPVMKSDLFDRALLSIPMVREVP
ncbi:DUF4142 domain-containing protein [Rhizobium sp. LjRoot98]|uniref:DUF4142 domain-containing protein n=1 Tax=Rhizobium sp. LjRoot98 TaxID=3342345 RepID=UPI003ECE1919